MIRIGLRTKSKVMAEYDTEAPIYALKRFTSGGGKYIDTTEKRLLGAHAKGPALLEVGTATGRFISFVQSNGWDYTGVDISNHMLESSNGFDCDLARADGEAIPFASSTFDSVICLHTFHFLPHPVQFVRESNRVLKRNGCIVLVFEMDTWLRRLVLKTRLYASHQYYFTIEEVGQTLKSNGFQVVAEGPVLRFPIEVYRKLPFWSILKVFDSSGSWPRVLATLGFVVANKL